jgi:hypothetical protein
MRAERAEMPGYYYSKIIPPVVKAVQVRRLIDYYYNISPTTWKVMGAMKSIGCRWQLGVE